MQQSEPRLETFEPAVDVEPDMISFTIMVPDAGVNFRAARAGLERELIQRALFQTKGNKAHAAKWLGLNRTTLLERMKALGFVLGDHREK